MADMTPGAVKPPVSPADVEKLDVRVGTIVAVEDVRAPRSSSVSGSTSATTGE